jgi:membrane associated rhomboid family serine protease
VAGQPDLFVVCKSCGSEVSPYITECPYCGNRLRKRAPKLDKGGVPKQPKQRRRPSAPSLSRLRPGEMPGVRSEGRPLATAALVLGAVVFTILVRASIVDPGSVLPIFELDWYRRVAAVFFYDSTAYELCALSAVFLFGWLLERRHGTWAPLLVFTLGSAAGIGVALAADPDAVFTGANAGALALLGAWAVRDLRAARLGEEIESDLLGVAAIGVLLLLLPAALEEPDPLAGLGGLLAGVLLGHGLARARER